MQRSLACAQFWLGIRQRSLFGSSENAQVLRNNICRTVQGLGLHRLCLYTCTSFSCLLPRICSNSCNQSFRSTGYSHWEITSAYTNTSLSPPVMIGRHIPTSHTQVYEHCVRTHAPVNKRWRTSSGPAYTSACCHLITLKHTKRAFIRAVLQTATITISKTNMRRTPLQSVAHQTAWLFIKYYNDSYNVELNI